MSTQSRRHGNRRAWRQRTIIPKTSVPRSNTLLKALGDYPVSRWTIVGVVVVPAALILGAIEGARRFAPDDQTRQFAIFAAVLAVGTWVFNYIKWIKDLFDEAHDKKKKEEDEKESLTLTATYDMHDVKAPVIGVNLFNNGKVTVPVKTVAMVVKTDEGDAATAMCVLSKQPGSNGIRKHELDRRLEPGDHADYFIPFGGEQLTSPARLVALAHLYRIVVRTFSGSRFEVTGETIKTIIEPLREDQI